MLMIIGSSLSTLLAIYYRLVIPLLAYTSGSIYSFSSQMFIYNILGIIGFVSGALFAAGFFIAIIKFIKAKKAAQ